MSENKNSQYSHAKNLVSTRKDVFDKTPKMNMLDRSPIPSCITPMNTKDNAPNIGETPYKFMNFGDFLNGNSTQK